MSLPNPNTVVTESRLKEFYNGILPYLGGSADAGFTPVGSVIAIMGVTAPANYLACDGTVYNIADYPELANYFYQQFGSKNKFGGNGTTTFAVPDLRGQFLRGTGTNSDTDEGSGSAVGVRQKATEHQRMMKGTSSNNRFTLYKNADENTDVQYADKGLYPTSNGLYFDATTYTVSGTVTAKYTSRPTNTSILWCIATKNIYLNPSLDYSTDEKVVGTWIDGKTLYQRTITGLTLPTITTDGVNENKNYTFNELSLGSLDFITVVNGATSGAQVNTAWNINNTTYVFRVMGDVNNNKIFAQCNRASLSGASFYITIQYTKTTT